MRVAFDEQIFAVQRHGGISRVFAELAREFISSPELDVQLQPVAAPLINEYLLADRSTREQLDIWPAKHWLPTLSRSLMRRRHKGPVDIVHNTFYLPRALKDYPQARRVVTVHDMIPELFPETRRRLDLLTVKKKYIQQAEHVVCVSESTKRDLVAVYGELSAPITVVHSGVGSEFHPGGSPLPGWPASYLIYVGHRSGYKDAVTLMKAFASLVHSYTDLQLVFVGGGSLTSHERELISALNISSRVVHKNVADRDMPAAYANAELFVFPSQYEGFGLPILEAMACGTPVLLANASALPEVGGDAAAYFPSGNPHDLALAMDQLLSSQEKLSNFRRAGLYRAGEFTWNETARNLAKVYYSTLE